MVSSKKVILLISPESWGQNFVSKHHYAKYLAKKHVVYFLNPAQEFKNLGKMNIHSEKVEANLHVLSYSNIILRLNLLPERLQQKIFRIQSQKILKVINQKIDEVWSFDPTRFQLQEIWNAEKYAYFAMDVHSKKSQELAIAQHSDQIFLVSECIRPQFADFNKKVNLLGHGAAIEDFKSDHRKVVLLGKNRIKATLIGNFNNNVDYDLLECLAKTNVDVDFIFIGPYKSNNLGNSGDKSEKIKHLNHLENIFFMGSIPPTELQKYLEASDINLVLYKEQNREINFNPHKLMAYFYSGKIIISSWIYEYENAQNTLITMTKSATEFLEKFTAIKTNLTFHNSEELQKKRREFALSNDYALKINYVEKIIHGNSGN